MRPISKYEAIGIFVSVALMAVVLVAVQYGANPFAVVSDARSEVQKGSIIVAGEDTGDEQPSLADALLEASTSGGKLKDLVVDDVHIGTGERVEEGDVVTVHYIGSTQDGIEFDSSYARGEPFTFTIGDGKVIEGWEKGLPGMQVGGQRILVIPSHMAYGDKQVGPIPAGSNLVFAVELLEIK